MTAMSRWNAILIGVWALSPLLGGTQTLNQSPRELVKANRPLTEAEVAAVLAASRQEVTGHVLHMAYQPDGPGPDMLMRADGLPLYLRATSGREFRSSSAWNGGSQVTRSGHVDAVTFIHYTGSPAVGCDGTPRGSELVLEYENEGSGWTVNARTRTPTEINSAAFDMLAGNVAVRSGQFLSVLNRPARAFVAPYKLPPEAAGGLPAGTTESLWLDVESLRPVRWTIRVPAVPAQGIEGLPDFGVTFTYAPSVNLRPPKGVKAPSCVR